MWYCRIRNVIILLMVMCNVWFASASAQQAEKVERLGEVEEVSGSDWYQNPQGYAAVERCVNVLNARCLPPHAMLIVIDHRLYETFTRNALHDLFGFDGGGLKVGLGLRYGVLNRLEVGAYRLNGTVESFDTYEFDAKLQLLNQESAPLDLAVRAGLSWFSQKSAEDASGALGQILLDRTIARRFTVGTGILYHSESSNDRKSTDDDAFSVAIPVLLEARLGAHLAWELELVENVGGYGSIRPATSSAIKIITNRHTFGILISNTQYIAADGVVTNTWRGFDDLILGFVISRQLDL